MKFDDGLSGWLEANQRALLAEIAEVRAQLGRVAGQAEQTAQTTQADGVEPLSEDLDPTRAAGGPSSALDIACVRLGLSSFERKVVILCAALELEPGFAALCALAQGDRARDYPTFALALAAFEDAHWSALAPSSPLRRWNLIELQPGSSLTLAPLRINEAFLHELAGVCELDPRIDGCVSPVDAPASLVSTHAEVARQIAQLLALDVSRALPAAVLLAGNDRAGQQQVAAQAFAQLGFVTFELDASVLAGTTDELEARARGWEREARLRNAALFVDAHSVVEPFARESLGRFLERFATPVAIGARHPLRFARRPVYVFDVVRPLRAEQRELWSVALGAALTTSTWSAPAASATATGEGATPRNPGEAALRALLERVTAQFDFDAVSIEKAAQRAHAETGATPGERIWCAARAGGRNELATLAQRLERRTDWSELVLPDDQLDTLRDIAAHARHRSTVHDEWGVGKHDERGLGLAALFHGPSGTGKTMAAEVLGTAMELDVFRVDLSQLVSKYIGETEKNLCRVFDAAQASGAILLFDECDAIFGRRGEVERGQDRYANLEVSYLLQRMEAYRGISILTTNMRNAIDPAFIRRLRFVVSFPFPDYAQRMLIWARLFGPDVPVDGVDFAQLARLNVAGGSIRNIVTYAAFLAADAAQAVTMHHLRRAALAECAKLERTPSEVEIGGWA
ncbi:ATPase [Paraburkholderia terrae]|uniref:ATPase n=1 Tax=Paraburkholderia terrae TaxID=311230 RepID=A0ABN6JWV0_9BURK|nr:ATP-binding protein [Paraburkholderia terrae]BCZ84357.1 ATPase [Paraburkholderia terrae]